MNALKNVQKHVDITNVNQFTQSTIGNTNVLLFQDVRGSLSILAIVWLILYNIAFKYDP